jgi:DNA polymerase
MAAVDQPGGGAVNGAVERGDQELSEADAAASALQWWLDAGVDALVAEEPRDWLRAPPATTAPTPAATAALPAGDAPPGQLDLFQAWLSSSGGLPYDAPSAPRVCPAGDPSAGLMVMIDMPSAEDCTAGTLLSGDVGRLFDRMLAAIGRDRGSIYFAALSCLRSADGRLSGEPEKQCALLARHHIGLAAPKALLLLGDGASKALLGLPVARARGRWHEVATHHGPVRTIATMSPRLLLTQPAQKAHAWTDLQLLMEGLK